MVMKRGPGYEVPAPSEVQGLWHRVVGGDVGMKTGQEMPAISGVKIDAVGLPVAQGCSDAPVSRMTVEELIALEQNALSEDATVNLYLGDTA